MQAPVSSTPQPSSFLPFALMIVSGVGFLIYYIYLVFAGIPTSRTEVFLSRNSRVMYTLVPTLLITIFFTVGAGMWIYSSDSKYKVLPLILTSFVSLLFSVLAMYFSQFQVTIKK